MHPLFLLAIVTFVLVAGFLVWNRASTKRHRFDNKQAGVGGESDPLAGANDRVRAPGELTASLDRAAATPSGERPAA